MQFLRTHKIIEIAVLILIVVVVAIGWFNSGFPTGHDALGGTVSPSAAARESLLEYHVVPQWTNHWYLGYPLFSTTPPLLNYLLLALSFPFGWMVATKMLYLALFALSGVFAYLFIYELTKNRFASFVTGLIYIFIPFHIIDSVFEGHETLSMAYMLTPLVFLTIERGIKEPGVRKIAIAGVTLAFLILTHPQVFILLIGPFIGLYVIFRSYLLIQEKRAAKASIIACILIFLLGLLLSASWWFPLLQEIDYLHATRFSLEGTKLYSATLLQALTLRHDTCCAPSGAYGVSDSILAVLLQWVPLVLAILGIIFNYKNKYVWFFSVIALITILFAMGPNSPVNFYEFGYKHLPFFTSIKTPHRFLLFTSFTYAVLAGFAVNKIALYLKPRIVFTVITVVSLLIVANTWQGSRDAFDTFELTQDQQGAIHWLSEQEEGRVMVIPMDTWVYNEETRYIVNPMSYTWLHGNEIVHGGTPSRAPKWTGNYVERIIVDCQNGPVYLGSIADLIGVKYAVVDKTDPVSLNYILDDTFTKIWQSNTIDIYENEDSYPRVFSLSAVDESVIDLWEGNEIKVEWAFGTQETILSLDDAHSKSGSYSLKSVYQFTDPSADSLALKTNVDTMEFGPYDYFHLSFYSEHAQPDIHVSLSLLEQDGSLYDALFLELDGIKAGWNEINYPISLFHLRYSEDENDYLDMDQIEWLLLGIGEDSDFDTTHEFEVYFDELYVLSQEINTDIEYTKISPGKYKVNVDFDNPSYLVLADSYYPNWVAKYNGKVVSSQVIFEALNGFYLEAGEYEVTLEYVSSPWRIAGNLLSGISVIIIVVGAVYLWIRKKRRQQQGIAEFEELKS